MKNKFLHILILFMSIKSFSQGVFKADFLPTISYKVQFITHGKSVVNKTGESSHVFDTYRTAILKFKQKIKNENYYIWKIKDYRVACIKCDKAECNFVNDLELIVKTDSTGKFINLVNGDMVKNKLQENLKAISKNNTFYTHMLNNPNIIMQHLETDVFTFFRYYGMGKITKNEDLKIKRVCYPFYSLELPFIVKYSSEKKDDSYNLTITNKLDHAKLSEEEWLQAFSVSENYKKYVTNNDYSFSAEEFYHYDDSKKYFDKIKIKTIKKGLAFYNKTGFTNYDDLEINVSK